VIIYRKTKTGEFEYRTGSPHTNPPPCTRASQPAREKTGYASVCRWRTIATCCALDRDGVGRGERKGKYMSHWESVRPNRLLQKPIFEIIWHIQLRETLAATQPPPSVLERKKNAAETQGRRGIVCLSSSRSGSRRSRCLLSLWGLGGSGDGSRGLLGGFLLFGRIGGGGLRLVAIG
jgi:hypothetical protein